MKSAFSFNGAHYISPSKKEARKFLRFYGDVYRPVYRYRTGWRLTHVEIVPSYAQMMLIGSKEVHFAMI